MKTNQFSRHMVPFVAAIIAVVGESIMQVQFNLTALASIGTEISSSVRMQATARDLIGFSPRYATYFVAPALLGTFLVAGWFARRCAEGGMEQHRANPAHIPLTGA